MKKGQTHSDETKRRMSESKKGELHPLFGKKHSEEARQKIRLARAKQVITEESKRKRSETQKGRTFSKESLDKMKQHALKRFSDKKNHPNYGKHLPSKTKENISNALKGKTLSYFHSSEKEAEIRKKIRASRAKQIFPKTDSSIEIKIQNFLKQLGIEFFTHQHMNIEHSYQCDILIPSKNLVIECDGIYWHNYPIGNDLDHIRTNELIAKGFRVLRLWELDIKDMNLNDFQETIK